MRAGRENDAALPWRARRRCVCAHATLFALRAKALQSGAPDIGVSRKKRFPQALCPSGALSARRGTRSPSLVSPAAAFLPCRPAGRTAGSARTRPRDPSLGNPFLGNRPHLSPSPVPQNAAGGKPLLVGLPPSSPSPPHAERNEAPMPPTRGAWVRVPRAEGTG